MTLITNVLYLYHLHIKQGPIWLIINPLHLHQVCGKGTSAIMQRRNESRLEFCWGDSCNLRPRSKSRWVDLPQRVQLLAWAVGVKGQIAKGDPDTRAALHAPSTEVCLPPLSSWHRTQVKSGYHSPLVLRMFVSGVSFIVPGGPPLKKNSETAWALSLATPCGSALVK